MKKEAVGVLIYRIKTLPVREPGFASGLCSMVCLWLVVIPALVMVFGGIEIALRQLIIPAICSLGLATVLFSRWKRLALRLEDEKGDMKTYSSESVERVLEILSGISSYFQWTGIGILTLAFWGRYILIKYIDNYNHVAAIQGFSIFALLVSFVLSRMYAYSKRRLDEVKQLTEEEITFFQHQYLGKFLWPHIFWGSCFVIFWLFT